MYMRVCVLVLFLHLLTVTKLYVLYMRVCVLVLFLHLLAVTKLYVLYMCCICDVYACLCACPVLAPTDCN
jgi:hypothetical protein